MNVSFDEFQANKEWCDDIAAKLPDGCWEDDSKAIGWVYLDALYIDEVQPSWPEATRKLGRWHLQLGNCEYVTDDLTTLEHKLYDYACAEGFCQKVI